jgi:hypothetical protein
MLRSAVDNNVHFKEPSCKTSWDYCIMGGTRQLGPQTSRPVSEDKSARKRGLVGPYVKTTRTINNYCCLNYFFNKIDGNHKDTVWHLSTVLGNVKKSPYIINHIFFKKLLWSHFWKDFYKCYTKTFGIVYILIGYLLIMLLWVIFICT